MKKHMGRRSCAAFLFLSVTGAALASSNDEIQVYDDAINKPGEFGLDVHTNYVASGQTVPDWAGDAPSNHSFRITPEFSYGLTDTWELGAYLPLLMESNGDRHLEGSKLRVKYLSAPKEASYYWGVNGELGRVSLRSEERNWNFELRPIIGYRIHKWQFTANPILSWALAGPQSGTPDFSPALRATYLLREDFSISLEHYAELGKLNNIDPYSKQTRNTYAVIDTLVAGHSVDFGVGRGWNAESDKWTIKAIVNFPLSAK